MVALHLQARQELGARLKEEQQQAKAEKRRREEKMDTEGGEEAKAANDGPAAAATAPAAVADDEADDGRRRRGRRGKKGGRGKERRGGRKAIGLDDDAGQLASELIAVPRNVLHDLRIELPHMSEQQRLTHIKDLTHRQRTQRTNDSAMVRLSFCPAPLASLTRSASAVRSASARRSPAVRVVAALRGLLHGAQHREQVTALASHPPLSPTPPPCSQP